MMIGTQKCTTPSSSPSPSRSSSFVLCTKHGRKEVNNNSDKYLSRRARMNMKKNLVMIGEEEEKLGHRLSLNDSNRRRRRRRSSICVSALANDDENDDFDYAQEGELRWMNLTIEETMDSLLVPFLALRRGSRFAHQEFVEQCTKAYDRAYSLQQIKTETYLIGLSTTATTENVNRMGTSEQEAFLSNVSMVYCTLHFMGVKAKRTNRFVIDPEQDNELKGIIGYVKMTHKNKDERDITLKRMEFEQRRVLEAKEENEDPRKYSKWDMQSGRNPNAKVNDVRQVTPGILLMRTNARLTLLAKEMVERKQKENNSNNNGDGPSSSDEEEIAMIKATNNNNNNKRMIEPQLALEWIDRPKNDEALLLRRNIAARALTAFFSVLTAHPKGLKAFSRACIDAYDADICAEDLVQSIVAAEFDCEASSRGMFGKGADAPKLFAGFVSAAYLTLQYRDETTTITNEKQKERPKTFAFANPPRWEEVELSNEGNLNQSKNAYDYVFELDEEKQIKYLQGFKTSIARWVSIGEKELFEDVSTSLSVDEDEYSIDDDDDDDDDVDAEFKSLVKKRTEKEEQEQLRAKKYTPSEQDEPLMDVNGLYAKVLFEISEFIANQSDQRKVAELLQNYTQKVLNAPIIAQPTLPSRSFNPETGKFVPTVLMRNEGQQKTRIDDDDTTNKTFQRKDDFFEQSSITLASLNVQRAICSFVLQERSTQQNQK
jgi:hypothetical protein